MEEMTRALISDQSIARGLVLCVDEGAQGSGEGGAQRSLISDASIARGLVDAASMWEEEEDGGGGRRGGEESVDFVQNELFLDHIDEDYSDPDSDDEGGPEEYHMSRATIADARLALLQTLVVATKLARMALLLPARHANTQQQITPPSEGAMSLIRQASSRIPRVPDILMEESDLFSLAAGDLNSSEPGGVTEAELSLIAQCQHQHPTE